jgi:hypothetical protein
VFVGISLTVMVWAQKEIFHNFGIDAIASVISNQIMQPAIQVSNSEINLPVILQFMQSQS